MFRSDPYNGLYWDGGPAFGASSFGHNPGSGEFGADPGALSQTTQQQWEMVPGHRDWDKAKLPELPGGVQLSSYTETIHIEIEVFPGGRANLLKRPDLLAQNTVGLPNSDTGYRTDATTDYRTDPGDRLIDDALYKVVDGRLIPYPTMIVDVVGTPLPAEPASPPSVPAWQRMSGMGGSGYGANGPSAATKGPIYGSEPFIAALTEQLLYRDLAQKGYSKDALDRLNRYYEDKYPLSEGNLQELLLKRSAAFATGFRGQWRQGNYRYALGNAQAGLIDLAGATIVGRTWKETAENLAKGMLLGGVLGSAFGGLRASRRPVVASESAGDIGGTRGPGTSLPATMNTSLSVEKPTFLANDVEVSYGADTTRVGNDWETIRTTERRKPWPGVHDAVVHSASKDGGRTLAPGVADPLPADPLNYYPLETNVAQIAEAIRWNPNLRPGQPIRVLSCALNPAEAQELANLTGHPIFASPFVVGVEAGTGELVVQQYIARAAADGYLIEMNLTDVSDKQVWNAYWPLY